MRRFGYASCVGRAITTCAFTQVPSHFQRCYILRLQKFKRLMLKIGSYRWRYGILGYCGNGRQKKTGNQIIKNRGSAVWIKLVKGCWVALSGMFGLLLNVEWGRLRAYQLYRAAGGTVWVVSE